MISTFRFFIFVANVSTSSCTHNDNCTNNAVCLASRCSCDEGFTENETVCEGIVWIMQFKEVMNNVKGQEYSYYITFSDKRDGD
jgi:hypothetical protein